MQQQQVYHLQEYHMVGTEVELLQQVHLQVLMAPLVLVLFHMVLELQVWQVQVQQQLLARQLLPQQVDLNFSLTVRFQSLTLESSTARTRTPTFATR